MLRDETLHGRAERPAYNDPRRPLFLTVGYARLPDDGANQRYHYAAPRFDYKDELVYDEFGLVLDYPRLAVRVA